MTRNPFEEMERAFERMGEQLEGFALERPTATVLVDVVDDGEAFVVTADLPGFDREAIQVRLTDQRLELAAEHDEEAGAEGPNYVRRERRRGSLRRSVHLPDPVEQEGATASLDDGVLTVTVPKATADESGTDIPVE
jgi:HSP20 family protein